MLKYKKIFSENGVVRYEYYPEGDVSNAGVVEFVSGKEPKLIKESNRDLKMYYALHALNEIDTMKESGTIAWY